MSGHPCGPSRHTDTSSKRRWRSLENRTATFPCPSLSNWRFAFRVSRSVTSEAADWLTLNVTIGGFRLAEATEIAVNPMGPWGPRPVTTHVLDAARPNTSRRSGAAAVPSLLKAVDARGCTVMSFEWFGRWRN